jgi:hypothetical protein
VIKPCHLLVDLAGLETGHPEQIEVREFYTKNRGGTLSLFRAALLSISGVSEAHSSDRVQTDSRLHGTIFTGQKRNLAGPCVEAGSPGFDGLVPITELKQAALGAIKPPVFSAPHMDTSMGVQIQREHGERSVI